MLTSPSTVRSVPIDPATKKALARIAKKKHELEIEEDDLIRKARAEGASLREIGDVLHINHVTVKNKLERERGVEFRPWSMDDPEVRF